MVATRLLFPERVTITPVGAGVNVDSLRRTPRHRGSASAQVSILAQVEERAASVRQGAGGGEITKVGQVTFMARDCEALGYWPAHGDVIDATAYQNYSRDGASEFYLTEPRRLDRGRLVVCDVATRHPARRAS